MSMNIFYFSATGNSLLACKELQKRSRDCSMQSIVKIGDEDLIIPSSNTVGLVFPVYFSGIPNKVEAFINKINFTNVDYIFVVATKSQFPSPGSVAEQIDHLLKIHNKKVNSVFYLDMIGNYIKKYNIADLEKQKSANDKALKKLDKIAEIVQKKENVIENPSPILKFVWRLMYNSWKKDLKMSDSEFVSTKCNSCGLCARICPTNNISITSSGPNWHHNCESCYGCIHVCPLKGIQSGKDTINKRRYINPNISVEELLVR